MPAPIVVPFNFEPIAVSVKTASYTIPAGRYARVTVNLEGSATFTIGGVTALRGTQNSVLASDNLRTFQGNFTVNGTNTQVANVLAADAPSNSSITLQAAGSAFNETTDQKTVIAELWLPSGTVINGTGVWRAVVQEFLKIS